MNALYILIFNLAIEIGRANLRLPVRFPGQLSPKHSEYDTNLRLQDVQIESIETKSFGNDVAGFSKWRHTFFKQQRLVCGFNSSNVHVFSQKIFEQRLSGRLYGFVVNPEEETIVDSVVFHRDDGIARLGVASRKKLHSPHGSISGILREFKIGEQVTEIFKTTFQGDPKVLKFICGLQSCTYAILLEHNDAQIKVERVHHSTEDINVIEIRIRDAVLLSSVRLQGVRHFVVGSLPMVFIYRLNHFMTFHKLISAIPFPGLRSIGAFRSGPSAYLALTADSSQKIIELRADGGWKTLHELSVPLASQFLPIYSVSFGTHIVALATRDRSKPFILYLFSGYSNELREVHPRNAIAQFLMLEDSATTFAASQEQLTVLFFDALGKRASILNIKYSLPSLRAPLHELRQEATRHIETAKAKLTRLRAVLDRAEAVMEHGAPKKVHLHRIPRHAKFREIEVRGVVHTKLNPSVRIGVADSNIVIQPDKAPTAELTSKLRELESRIKYAKGILSKAVLRNDSRPMKTSKLSIAGNVDFHHIESETTNVDFLAKEPAQKVIDSLYFIGEDATLKGRLIFRSGISATSITVSTLNDRSFPQDFVVAGEKLRLFGEYNFTRGLSLRRSSLVQGPLGPLSDASKVLTVSRSTRLSLHRTIFDNVIILESVAASSLNGIKLRELSEKLLRPTSNQDIRSLIILHGNVRTGSLNVGTANGLKLEAPLKRFVYRDIPSVITGRKNFESVNFKGGVQARHTLNGLRIPEDLMLRHVEQRVTARKTFSAGLSAISIIQSGLLNGFSFPKEVASLTSPSSIEGHIEFRQGADFSSIRTSGPIDDLNVEEFMERKNISLYHRPIVFHGKVSADEVHVGGTFDGENIRKVWDDIIPAPLNSRDSAEVLEISGSKTFAAGLSARAIRAPLINGLNTNEDLARIGKPIGGRKILRGNLQVNHLSSKDSLLNGINVRKVFNERVTLSSPQIISKSLIMRDLRANRLEIKIFNGTRFPADYITTHLPETIPGDLRCEKLVIRSKRLHPNERISTPFIVGVSDALKHRLPLNGDISLNRVSVANIDSRFVNAAKVDGVDFASFAQRVLRDDQGEIKLFGKNVFESLEIDAPFSTRSVNGYDLARLNDFAVSTIRPTTIHVPIAFKDELIVKAPMKTSKIHSQNADTLRNIASLRDSKIFAPVRIRAKVRSMGSVDAEFVNNAVLGRDFLTVNTPQTIPVNVALGGTVFVKERIDGMPTINGIDIRRLEKTLARVSPGGHVTLNSPLIFDAPLKLDRDLHAEEVNGEILKKLVALAPCLSEGILNSLEIEGSLELTHGALVHNYNNKKNLPEMMQRMVFNDGRTYRLNQTTFRNLRVEDVLTCEQMQHRGTLNGFPLEQILRETIPTSSPKPFRLRGSMILGAEATIESLVVDGPINGIRLPEGVLRKCEKCGLQKLQNVTVIAMDVMNIITSSKDHPSYELWNTIKENRVLSSNEVIDQILTGRRPVNKLIVDGNLEVGTINAKPFTQRLNRINNGTIGLQSPIFNEASFADLSLGSADLSKCTPGGLTCQIRSLQQRKCFDWSTNIPRFQNVILERGVHTREINGVALEPERFRKSAAMNTLSLRLMHAQNALEIIDDLDERLLDC